MKRTSWSPSPGLDQHVCAFGWIAFTLWGSSVKWAVSFDLAGNYEPRVDKARHSAPKTLAWQESGCINLLLQGFPGGAVVENLPANARDTGSSLGLGRSHMPRSSWAREPQLLSLRVWSLCSATREVAIVRGPRTAMKSGPHLPQLEKALAQKRRPNTAINK